MNAVIQTGSPPPAAQSGASKQVAAKASGSGFSDVLGLLMNMTQDNVLEQLPEEASPDDAGNTPDAVPLEFWLLGVEQLQLIQPPVEQLGERVLPDMPEAALPPITNISTPDAQASTAEIPGQNLEALSGGAAALNEAGSLAVKAAGEDSAGTANLNYIQTDAESRLQAETQAKAGNRMVSDAQEKDVPQQVEAGRIFPQIALEKTIKQNPADAEAAQTQEILTEQEALQQGKSTHSAQNSFAHDQGGTRENGMNRENSIKPELVQEEPSAGAAKQEAHFEQILQQAGAKGDLDTAEKPVKLPASQLAEEFPQIIKARLQKSGAAKGAQDLIIQLEPKSLGKVTVRLSSHDGIVAVKIMVERAESKALIDSQMPALKQNFSEQGVKYGQINVEVGGQFAHQEAYQQRQSWQTGAPARQGYAPAEEQSDEIGIIQEAGSKPRNLWSGGAVDYLA
ncbi:MAG: flagellar hook-length control protein FliK [Clostridia bacterium]|nr:flagellar hook-length control protein FliK [Clostridia bacterium]